MYTYDGHSFQTFSELLSYCVEKFGETGAANFDHLQNWGTDLSGQQMYQDGTVYLGRTQAVLKSCGLSKNNVLQQLVDRSEKYYSSYSDLTNAKTSAETVIDGKTYINGAVKLGTEQTEGSQILTMTKSVTTDNGTTLNQPNIMTAEKIEDPTIPGTFSYLATLKALGWLPVSGWAMAASPLLGVGLGVALYDLNPQFWTGLSQALLPWAFEDNGETKMPISVDENGNVYTPEEALEALRQYLINSGVYTGGAVESPDNLPSNIQRFLERQTTVIYPFTFYNKIIYKDGSTERYVTYEFTDGAMGNIIISQSLSGTTYYVAGSKTAGAKVTTYIGSTPGASDIQSPRTNEITGTFTADGLTAYVTPRNSGNHSITPILGEPILFSGSVDGSKYYNQNFGWIAAYGLSESVSGATKESGATYPTDTSKTLSETYPSWAENGIDVVSNPVATTIENGVKRWLPMSLSDTNYSDDTDNTYSTETQTDAQTGENTKDNQLEQIMEGLYDLIDTLTREGQLPSNPTPPSDTTGDTPTPNPPVITGAGSDLISIYNPTKQEIQAFNQFLWSLDPTQLVNWKKVIQNPIEAIISLHMIYCSPITGGRENIKCGYIESNVASDVVTSQYTDIDCGTVTINEFFHNIWDYVATEIQIYLPFIGIVPLHTSDIMNSSIHLTYRVDVFTGTCLAQLTVTKENSVATLYTFTGNCAVMLPLSGGSFSNIMSTLVVMGGLVLSGNVGTAANYAIGRAVRGELQQHVQRSGNIGANAGALGIRKPYIIITRKKSLDATDYHYQYGYPANKTVTLSAMHGYTRIKSIHLSGIPCTDNELELIEQLLKEGVIIN